MDDTPPNQNLYQIQGVSPPNIGEDEAKSRTREWIESQNFFSKKQPYRIGKAVMVYYPYWEFIREDGSKIKTFYRPACGTLMTDLQKLNRPTPPSEIPPENLATLPITINPSYYYSDIHGIPRGERLVAIPFWLISYKVDKSIYMLKIDAETGDAMPEWHPFKESVNWRKIAIISFIPLVLISFAAILIHPFFFIIDALLVIFLIYQSRMFALIKPEEEDKNGS